MSTRHFSAENIDKSDETQSGVSSKKRAHVSSEKGARSSPGQKKRKQQELTETPVKGDEDYAAYIAKKREASRVSSRRTRERERMKLDHFSNLDMQLENENKQLRSENEQLRALIKAIKDLKPPPGASSGTEGASSRDHQTSGTLLQATVPGKPESVLGSNSAIVSGSTPRLPHLSAARLPQLNTDRTLLERAAASVMPFVASLPSNGNQNHEDAALGPSRNLSQQHEALLGTLLTGAGPNAGNFPVPAPQAIAEAARLRSALFGSSNQQRYPQSTFFPAENQRNRSYHTGNTRRLEALRQSLLSGQQENSAALRESLAMNHLLQQYQQPTVDITAEMTAPRLPATQQSSSLPFPGMNVAAPTRSLAHQLTSASYTLGLAAQAVAAPSPASELTGQERTMPTASSVDLQQQQASTTALLTEMFRASREPR